jgi:hypothetical protein
MAKRFIRKYKQCNLSGFSPMYGLENRGAGKMPDTIEHGMGKTKKCLSKKLLLWYTLPQ